MKLNIMEQNKRFSDYNLEPVFRIPRTEQFIVPHYINPHQWVGLGGATWTTAELIESKAKPEIRCIWARPWTEFVFFKGKPRTLAISELEVLIRARL
jgi:hypothetical protein